MATQPVPGLNITRYQGDLSNPDVATAQTVEVMCDQIAKASNDRLVQRAARDAVNRFRGGLLYASAGIDPWKNQCAQAESVWWWAKHGLKFQHHDGMIAVYFNERDQLQLLISPDLLLRMGKPRGDCAIYTMLICAMLRCLGIDSEIVTAAVDPSIPDVFSHVYPRAVLQSGRRLVLDASHGTYPGWEVPAEHTLRKQVWDLSGNPISDQAPRFKGLHAYAARPDRPILPKRLAMLPGIGLSGYIRGNRGLGVIRGGRNRGLGDDITVLNPSLDPTQVPITNPGGVYPVSTPVQVSGPGFNWSGTIGGLLNQWTQIASNVIAPRNTITTGPQGTSVNLAAGSSLPAGAFALPGAVGGIGVGTILIGGVVLVALFMALGKKN